MGLFGGKKKAETARTPSAPAAPAAAPALKVAPTPSAPSSRRPGVVVDWIAGNVSARPDKVATIDLHTGRRHTYAQMHERVARLTGFMKAQGVQKGDRVCVLSLNSTDMLDIQYACWRIGAIYLPLNFRLTAPELVFIVGDAAPALGFLDETFT
ncbi:MAG: AMP-binding protein, partial [Maricaulaceae bacterium]